MARPTKETVDYFPHTTSHGKTIFILESKWGNDGYAFWFKLLETLGSKPGMVIDCDDVAEWELLTAKTRTTHDKATDILNTLANLDAIDKDLWSHRVVFCQALVDGVADAFKRRIELLPTLTGVSAYINPVKAKLLPTKNQKGKGKGKDNNKEKFKKPTLEEVKVYCEERGNGIDPQHFIDVNDAKGWVVGKFQTPMKDWKAVIRTWEQNKKNNKPTPPKNQYNGYGGYVG